MDVAIVGAGYTGLWTAYYLAKADPHLRIAVVEKEIAGFGASGRNGGWVSPFFATPLAKLAKSHGREAAIAMQTAMFATVDEVGRVAAEEGIDAQYHKGGCLWLSTSPGQTPRVRERDRRAARLRLRRGGLGVARAARGAGAAARRGLPRRHLQPALRVRPSGAPRPRPGGDRRRWSPFSAASSLRARNNAIWWLVSEVEAPLTLGRPSRRC